jgi:hypothetical protein
MPNSRIQNANALSLHNLHVSRLSQRIDAQLEQEGFAYCCGVKVKQNHFHFGRGGWKQTAPYTAWGGPIGPAMKFESVRDIASMIDELMTRNDAIYNLQH